MNLQLNYSDFQTDLQQLGSLHLEFEWQLLEDSPAESIDNHVVSILGRNAALLAVKKLVVANL